ncbi:junctophilin-1-like [Pollicipes pollicipes]|uniref:junctophilin-1-like n=1 Tax=Pollicipes pollicipes TaxID=41117 RepID=UPI0018855703|nr:junctophilin-1-like [Pollicipes pollicipes]
MDSNTTETYMGEWKNDRRVGYGVCERSDGLKYEGEWYNNKKYGYGVTTFRDGTKEEGKYKNNVIITSNKKKHLFLIRSAKFRERIEAAVNAANRASKIALQKADIAISRTATARGKAEQADIAALHSREDSDIARIHAKQFAPDFHQPGNSRRAPPSIRLPLRRRSGTGPGTEQGHRDRSRY